MKKSIFSLLFVFSAFVANYSFAACGPVEGDDVSNQPVSLMLEGCTVQGGVLRANPGFEVIMIDRNQVVCRQIGGGEPHNIGKCGGCKSSCKFHIWGDGGAVACSSTSCVEGSDDNRCVITTSSF